MKAETLPYDIGNCGDLIKHGMIAEFTAWRCRHYQEPFVFYDPFGGRPWIEPPHRKVIERMLKLGGCALTDAQPEPDIRYYGSGHLVKRAAHSVGSSAKVFVSDRNKDALDDLTDSGLERIDHKDFNPENGYSLLDCNLEKSNASLVLLDPFADFLGSSVQLLPKIINFVEKTEVTVALFVLRDSSMTVAYNKFDNLRKTTSNINSFQLSFSCPQLFDTGIRGEEKYRSEIILFLPKKYNNPHIGELKNRLDIYAEFLTQVLAEQVKLIIY